MCHPNMSITIGSSTKFRVFQHKLGQKSWSLGEKTPIRRKKKKKICNTRKKGRRKKNATSTEKKKCTTKKNGSSYPCDILGVLQTRVFLGGVAGWSASVWGGGFNPPPPLWAGLLLGAYFKPHLVALGRRKSKNCRKRELPRGRA